MSVPAELNHDGFDQEEDALRALVSSILSGQHEEQVYLRQVSARCLEEPESAPTLLGLIDRYYRLGRMPAEQYQKVKAKIEQAMGTRPPDDNPPREPAREDTAREKTAREETAREDDDSEESVTRELTPARAATANQASRHAKTPA